MKQRRFAIGAVILTVGGVAAILWRRNAKKVAEIPRIAAPNKIEDVNYPSVARRKIRYAKHEEDVDAPVPENVKVFVRTFGCSHNTADSEMMKGLLRESGFCVTDTDEATAQCVIINSCTVKDPSQAAMATMIRRCQQRGQVVVVAGCVPQADRYCSDLVNVSLLGTTQISRVVEVVEQALHGNVVCLLEKGNLPSLEIPRVRRNKLIEVIPISTGCLGVCTYCKTRQARGALASYPMEDILQRIATAAKEGVQQVWFTSEDTGAYGIDKGTTIAELLGRSASLLAALSRTSGKHLMLRLGMTNPPYIKNHLEQVARVLNHPHVFKFIHIPVQSGSDQVLLKMRRDYTCQDFESLVDGLLRSVPDLTIATDIICGFPGETDEDHQATIKLIKKYKFQIINISQFYPRPGTPAAHYKRVPTQIVKQRSTEITDLFHSYTSWDSLKGQRCRVWFDDIQREQVVAHTASYAKVVVKAVAEDVLGTSQTVFIEDTTKWHITATLNN